MDLNDITLKILESKDITVIAPKDVIAHILLRLNRISNWMVSTKYDINDDNVLRFTKLEIKNPRLFIETALFKDGRLNQSEGNELIIEKSSLETMDRFGVKEELLENFKDYYVFNK